MLSFLIYAIIFSTPCIADFVEDLQSVFVEKHCVEASLVSIPSSQDDMLMLDSSSQLEELLNDTEMGTKPQKYDKTTLAKINELAQYNEIGYVFTLISEEGPPHAKLFKLRLLLGGEKYEGTGPSIKKAQQNAAAVALENTSYELPPEKIKQDQEKSLTPTVALNNVAAKLGIGVVYHLRTGKEEKLIDSYGSTDEAYGKSKSFFPKWNSTFENLRIPVEEAQTSGPFTIRVKVGSLFFEGVGHTIQAARHAAALKALQDLERQALYKDNACSREDSVEECKKLKDNLKSPVSRIYEEAQRRNLEVEFTIIDETGKPHKKVFVTQCKLGDYVTQGEGNSKKESKRVAAEAMLKHLPHLDDNFNEKGIINGLKNKKRKKNKRNNVKRDNVKSFVNSITDVVSSVWKTDESSKENIEPPTVHNAHKKSSSRTGFNFKDKLLEMGNNLNIQVGFVDLRKQNGFFYSLASLGVNPPQICLGKAPIREKSHDVAALHGLKFLQKSGLLDKTEFAQERADLDIVLQDEENYKLFEDFES